MADGKIAYKTSNSRNDFVEVDQVGNVIRAKFPATPEGTQLVGGEAPVAREELTVWVGKTADGQFEPIAYEYVPNYLNSQRPGFNFNKTCYLEAK